MPVLRRKAMFTTILNKSSHSAVGVTFKIKCTKCKTEFPKSYECEIYMDQDGGIGTGDQTMGRLIDADILKQELYQQWFMDILLTQKSSMDMFYALAQKIDAQPTAYDPELVAQQLEAYSDVGEAEQLGTIPIVELADAIKIVKGGGVGND